MTIYKGTQYIAGIPTNYVTTNTTQIINGSKVFTNSISMRNAENMSATFAANKIEFRPVTTSSNGGHIDFHYAGNSNNTSRIIEEGSGYLRIETRNPNDNSEISSVYMGYRNGNFFTRCPASDADNSITTTVSTGQDYVKLGNGLIIQWGTITSSGTVTFSLPYTSADSYSIGMIGNSDDTREDSITNLTDTGFDASKRGGNRPFRWIAIGK